MKKTVILALFTLTALSLSACGSKKEPVPEPETSTIADEPVALAPEPEEEEVIEEGFKCLDEMYSYTLEDGVIQIDDIIVHMGKTQTLGEILAAFNPDRYIIDYCVDGLSATREYLPTAEIDAKTQVEIIISHRQGTKLLKLDGFNILDEPAPIVDCNYRGLTIEDYGYDNIWLPGGYKASGEAITLDNLADGFFKDLTLGEKGNMMYNELASYTDNYEYVGYVYNRDEMTYGSHLQDGSQLYYIQVYKYELSFDKATRNCKNLTITLHPTFLNK